MGNAASGRAVSLELVQRAERLLSSGRSIDDVADQVGLHKSTVAQILRGVHPQQRARLAFVRCPDCGGLVQMPCKLCALRAQQAAQRKAA